MNCAENVILITGRAGFIGSNLVPNLLNRGHRIIVLDNLSTGNLANFGPIRANSNFTFIEGDIRNRETVRTALRMSTPSYIWQLK